MTTISPTATGSVQYSGFQDMDLESMVVMVQMTRVGILEQQLSAQINTVQAKNEQAAKLNTLLGLLNKGAAMFGGDANAGTEIGSTDGWKDDRSYFAKNVNDAIKNAGIGDAGLSGTPGGELTNTTTKGQLDGLIQQVKATLDSSTNSQQMDMLRVQSLNNRRSEAFEMCTNCMKKWDSTKASVLANCRG